MRIYHKDKFSEYAAPNILTDYLKTLYCKSQIILTALDDITAFQNKCFNFPQHSLQHKFLIYEKQHRGYALIQTVSLIH